MLNKDWNFKIIPLLGNLTK